MLFLSQVMQIVKLAIGMPNTFLEETKEKCKKNADPNKRVEKQDWLGQYF